MRARAGRWVKTNPRAPERRTSRSPGRIEPIGRVLREQPFGEVQTFMRLGHLLPQRAHLLLQRLKTAGGVGVRACGAACGLNLRDLDCDPPRDRGNGY